MAERSILVADDAPNIRKVVKMGFEALGYRVLTAENGRDALAIVHRETPDLVILDVMMPEMNGYDVCAEIKRDPILRRTPVVMLTAKNLEEDKYWGRELGADEYITKPYDPEELERVVERIFAARAVGEGYHPLTHLPNWAAVEHETAQRRLRGEPYVLLACRFAAEAAETYRMKYGNIRMDAVMQELAALLAAETTAAAAAKGFVGHAGDDVLYLALPPEAVATVRSEIDAKFCAAAPHYYQEGDATRGCILRPGETPEDGSPLLSLVWREAERHPG
jgi:CheY-like chemotaxis protein